MLPDLSDTRINVAQIGFCWQLTGPAVARLLRILINSFWGGGGEGVWREEHALFYIDLLCVVIFRNIPAVLNNNSLYPNSLKSNL